MEGDFVYFSRRADEERRAAIMAPHSRARAAHLDMADRYAELATAIASHHPRTDLKLRVSA
jgi:hypothetical protein